MIAYLDTPSGISGDIFLGCLLDAGWPLERLRFAIAPLKLHAGAVFTRLADAEAKVHGTTRDTIHFHEVGAVDAIIDIVGTCAGLHDLGVEKLFASPMPLGAGWTKSAHGQIP